MNNELFWKSVEPLHPQAQAFCRKLVGCREDGDDLYQDALVTGLNKCGTLREEASFKPWLYRIIVNSFHNRNRQPWYRLRSPLTATTDSGSTDPSGQYDARHRLDRAFRSLNTKDKALVILFEIEGWTIAELAELTGRPSGTIKAKLSRSRKKMRRAIADDLPEADQTCKQKEAGYALPPSSTINE